MFVISKKASINQKIGTPLIVSVVFFLMVTLNLQFNPMKGIADNHDFNRMMTWIGVTYPPQNSVHENYINWINRFYISQKPQLGEVYSSELLFLWIAKMINHFINQSVFDIKILGFVHTLFFSLALFFVVYFIQKINKFFLLLVVPFIFFVLADSTYVTYFNSFYQEPAGLIFFVSFVANLLHFITTKHKSTISFFTLTIFACLMITAKAQYFPMIIPVAVVILLLGYKRVAKKIICFSICFLMVCSLGYYIFATPQIIKKWNVYNTIFAQILGSTNNPTRAITLLNIDPVLIKYAGIPAYFLGNGVDDPTVQKYLNTKYYLLTIKYYLLTPSEAIDLGVLLSKLSFTTKIDFLGYYEVHKNLPAAQQPKNMVLWSNFKSDKLSVISSTVFIFLGVSLIVFVVSFIKQQKNETTIGIFLTLCALVQFLVVLLSEGSFGIPEKHLFLYNIAFDSLLLYWLIIIISKIRVVLNKKPLSYKVYKKNILEQLITSEYFYKKDTFLSWLKNKNNISFAQILAFIFSPSREFLAKLYIKKIVENKNYKKIYIRGRKSPIFFLKACL